MYRALYRKWRPAVFDDVCGQDHITSILKYQVAEGKLSHAYLFCGSRGTGKTSCAKILAKAVNCENPKNGNPCGECAACRSVDDGTALDIIEMDAASNNGVGDVRDIREEVNFTPAALKYRVYIIDEVHMLTDPAFNALLKTLEEPPSHIIFILATTELHQLPATIISRCQRFDFHKLSAAVIASRLEFIAKNESFTLTDGGAHLIARLAEGGMRDAIGYLELCGGTAAKIDEELVTATLGLVGRDELYKLVGAIRNKNYEDIFAAVAGIENSARDIAVFWRDLISFYRDLLVVKSTKSAKNYLELSDEEYKRLSELAAEIPLETMLYHTKLLEETMALMQKAESGRRGSAEIALLRMSDMSLSDSAQALSSRISELERKLAGGYVAPKPTPAKAEPAAPAVTQTTDTAPQQTKEETDGEKPLPYWSDVVSNLRTACPSITGYISGTAAVCSNGKIIIYAKAFDADMLNDPSKKSIIVGELSAAGGKPVADADVIITTRDGGNAHSAIDDIKTGEGE